MCVMSIKNRLWTRMSHVANIKEKNKSLFLNCSYGTPYYVLVCIAL